jgi:hypothetical protein
MNKPHAVLFCLTTSQAASGYTPLHRTAIKEQPTAANQRKGAFEYKGGRAGCKTLLLLISLSFSHSLCLSLSSSLSLFYLPFYSP